MTAPVCDCELRNRQWNPNTGRCETCRRNYHDRRDLDDRASRAAHVAALPTPTELRQRAAAGVAASAWAADAGRLAERADVLEYLHGLVADCDRGGGPINATLAMFFATTANEIAGRAHLVAADVAAVGRGGS